jgi:hypothetical protein
MRGVLITTSRMAQKLPVLIYVDAYRYCLDSLCLNLLIWRRREIVEVLKICLFQNCKEFDLKQHSIDLTEIILIRLCYPIGCY